MVVVLWQRILFPQKWKYIYSQWMWKDIFNTPVTYFLKYFRGKFREILTVQENWQITCDKEKTTLKYSFRGNSNLEAHSAKLLN